MRLRYWFLLLWVLALGGCQEPQSDSKLGLRTFHYRDITRGSGELREAVSGQILLAQGQDAFGEIYTLPLSDQTWELIRYEEGVEVERYALPPGPRELWAFRGSEAVYTQAPPALPEGDNELVIYLALPPEEAVGAGLHVWDAVRQQNWTKWESPLPLLEGGVYGSYVRIPLPPDPRYTAGPAALSSFPDKLGLMLQSAGQKLWSNDLVLNRPWVSRLLFVGAKRAELSCTPDLKPCDLEVVRDGAAAHWVGSQEILWKPKRQDADRFVLLASKDGLLPDKQVPEDWSRFLVSELTPVDGSSPYLANQAHLQSFGRFLLNDGLDASKLVKQELMVAALNKRGRVIELTRVQTASLLDELFATEQALGLTLGSDGKPTLAVWAPTAQSLSLQIYDAQKRLLDSQPMRELRGVWQLALDPRWIEQRLFYRYAIKVFHPKSGRIESYEVTDPYSVSLSANSRYSQLLDLSDPQLVPQGWNNWQLAAKAPEDMSIYEVHVRDFSSADLTVPKSERGLYRAFRWNGVSTPSLSRGMAQLKKLKDAGLSHVQLLPVFDFATVNEDSSQRLSLEDPFDRLCVRGKESGLECPSQLDNLTISDAFDRLPNGSGGREPWLQLLAEQDAYNWGYDPFHYGVPEGSYASDPEGPARILEFRELVQSLHELGLSVALDVVYNHTFAAGLQPESVLDRLVPGYYHRLDPLTGAVERSTCCENTASERQMMEKLMRDTLRLWVETYKVDAFRFDLMGHHMKRNIEAVQKALGPERFLYGEAWDFGELAGGVRGANASQKLIGGLGVGSFNDRLRDAVRGGGPFDCGYILGQQGPVQGLGTYDKAAGGLLEARQAGADCRKADDFQEADSSSKRKRALALQDMIRLGLLGTLADVELLNAEGKRVLGRDLNYNGQSAGYAAAPREIINYVQNHDNQTLWDVLQMKLPRDLSAAERLKVHILALSFPLLSQGIPYLEMGSEILRSKALYRDAYNAGDWVNAIDWSLSSHNWYRSLPSEREEPANHAFAKEVQAQLAPPSAEAMQEAFEATQSLLRLRSRSPLFRLRSTAAIQERLDFPSGTEASPGLIVLRLSDELCAQADLDSDWTELILIYNLGAEERRFTYSQPWREHPLWTKALSEQDGTVRVPGRTLAVLGIPQGLAKHRGCRAGMLEQL